MLGELLPEVPDDVETARGIINQHQPCAPTGHPDNPVRLCASATHQIYAPLWPCDHHRWAVDVLAADDRGEILPAVETAV
ncbi:hypothetical protein [Cryptosporangium minutisporangium]|uniref:Uncharacterized protein n=1 Tax=Cryptosporangium minutisporangium TaxID=113569 RepID=A0ABP6SVJ4_9ACTN